MFSVKKVDPAVYSRVSGPSAFETPSSGLKDQRLVPRFTARLESYWPIGAVTAKLAPMIRSCRYASNSFRVSAGAP